MLAGAVRVVLVVCLIDYVAANLQLRASNEFQKGLEYYILYQQGEQLSETDSYLDLAKKHLKLCAMQSSGVDGNNEKWQSLFLLGDLLQRSDNVSPIRYTNCI